MKVNTRRALCQRTYRRERDSDGRICERGGGREPVSRCDVEANGVRRRRVFWLYSPRSSGSGQMLQQPPRPTAPLPREQLSLLVGTPIVCALLWRRHACVEPHFSGLHQGCNTIWPSRHCLCLAEGFFRNLPVVFPLLWRSRSHHRNLSSNRVSTKAQIGSDQSVARRYEKPRPMAGVSQLRF
jgi:hypothetical protein